MHIKHVTMRVSLNWYKPFRTRDDEDDETVTRRANSPHEDGVFSGADYAIETALASRLPSGGF